MLLVGGKNDRGINILLDGLVTMGYCYVLYGKKPYTYVMCSKYINMFDLFKCIYFIFAISNDVILCFFYDCTCISICTSYKNVDTDVSSLYNYHWLYKCSYLVSEYATLIIYEGDIFHIYC